MFGLEMDDDVAAKILNLGNNTDEPLGILAVSESGTSFGLSEFLDMSKQSAIDTYGITGSQHQVLKEYCNDWMEGSTLLPLILVGGEGYISASEFVNQSFGSVNPIDDSYTEFSLNIGGEWGTGAYGFPAGNPIDLTKKRISKHAVWKVGLTTSWGASMFLYGN